ncbi:MAG: dipicolinate synthase subunit B [Clostridia bacterium]|nr:dipicolinate synthase subunit B [Clostridia bacterium]
MEKIKLGYAICGSFCTFSKALEQIKILSHKNLEITPIFSDFASKTDTRFFEAKDFIEEVEKISGNKAIKSIVEAEPIGPKKMFHALVVAPCTGNTLAKLANGITDTTVTMAVKAHLRNNRPVILGISTNDALGASAQNIGRLMNVRNIFFVPFKQDDSIKKPRSIVCDFEKIEDTVKSALNNEQIQPIIL